MLKNQLSLPNIGENLLGGIFVGIDPDISTKILILSPKVFEAKLTWEDAVYYCKNLTIANYTDWALPSKKQLIACSKIKDIIPESELVANDALWSSHVPLCPYTFEGSCRNAWFVDFHVDFSEYEGKFQGPTDKSRLLYVRAVRSVFI